LSVFSTPQDVLTRLTTGDHRVLRPRFRPEHAAEALTAVVRWRAEGSPVVPVAVTPLAEGQGVRVTLEDALVRSCPALVEEFIHVATPYRDRERVRRVNRPVPSVIELQGRDLDAQEIKAHYERFLSVRRFSNAPLFVRERLGEGDPELPADLGEVSVELDEDDGDVIVSFDDEVAHEHGDLVEACVSRCSGFPGVEQADWEDRELIVLRGSDIDLRRLEQGLLAFVRARLANRSSADCLDDDA
ncbi:MAG TPA: hypothetical protein VHG90_10855, partial [Acidimicrobiales bacterium]|nr:hypothetical protein [Acidimicrobiales bacterium]